MTPAQAFDALQPHLNAWGASKGKEEVMKILQDTAMTPAELEEWLKSQPKAEEPKTPEPES